MRIEGLGWRALPLPDNTLQGCSGTYLDFICLYVHVYFKIKLSRGRANTLCIEALWTTCGFFGLRLPKHSDSLRFCGGSLLNPKP